MGAKKNKNTPQEPRQKNKRAVINNPAECELSAIAAASFIEGLQQNTDAPLHSTALEEDLKDQTDKKHVQKKSTKLVADPEGNKNTNKPKSTPQKSKKPGPVANAVDRKKAVKRKSAGHGDEARPVKKQKVKVNTKTTEPESGRSSDAESQEHSDENISPQVHSDLFTSDEDPEENWKPSPKKFKAKSFGPTRSRRSSSSKSRKSSSGSGYHPDKRRQKKKVKRSGSTQLEVVLDEFLDFYEQYKETVESKAVKKSLDRFASNVEDQLTEKISSSKQLKALIRENSKLASAIRTKRQRLLDAKNELIKSERQLWLLQKSKSELEQNLEDLNCSKIFLQNIRKLNTRYLEHRRKHQDEKETYDASSLPALLTEAKHVQTTERQLKAINDRLEKAVQNKVK